MTDSNEKPVKKTSEKREAKKTKTSSDKNKPWLSAARSAVTSFQTSQSLGRVEQAVGTIIKAISTLPIGELCILKNANGTSVQAEVVGVERDLVLLTVLGDARGISTQTVVVPTGRSFTIRIGKGIIGRVIDALGNPIDQKGALRGTLDDYPGIAFPPNPFERPVIDSPIPIGIRAIDGILTCGEGQRLGIFAAAGGGKSTLLSMIVRFAAADIIIVALIGERGREVREFIEEQLGPEGMARSVVIVATSDRPAIEQVKAAYTATAIAEYFRDRGKKVMLLMDSLTRFARAQRQIGLAAGEPPTRRGFPPSVFEHLPRLVERAGRTVKGSITAFYTVLVEGDDMTEPVADETRSLLDGHIILSRELGEKGHYPAIDVLASVSRVMPNITDDQHIGAAINLRSLLAKWRDIELLVKIGEYVQGSDALADEAIRKVDAINSFLQQGHKENSPMEHTMQILQELAR
jgi:type III secretion protein N (ATPase)